MPLQSGASRFCKKCKCYKPPRSHHCRVCGICVLRMVRCSIMLARIISLILQSSDTKASNVHHQCSIATCNLRACKLMQDHHCPWTNNCVGHGNYKTFLLFLVCKFSCDACCKSKEHFQQAKHQHMGHVLLYPRAMILGCFR